MGGVQVLQRFQYRRTVNFMSEENHNARSTGNSPYIKYSYFLIQPKHRRHVDYANCKQKHGPSPSPYLFYGQPFFEDTPFTMLVSFRGCRNVPPVRWIGVISRTCWSKKCVVGRFDGSRGLVVVGASMWLVTDIDIRTDTHDGSMGLVYSHLHLP